jgi:hypothetical protein
MARFVPKALRSALVASHPASMAFIGRMAAACAAVTLTLALSACGTRKPTSAAAEAAAAPADATGPAETPSKSAGTYHGELFRARERANESLEKTDQTRRQQIKEADEFERKPTPKADPTP